MDVIKSFESKHLYCVKCGYAFMFSSDEQMYFEKRRFFPRTSCHACCKARTVVKR